MTRFTLTILASISLASLAQATIADDDFGKSPTEIKQAELKLFDQPSASANMPRRKPTSSTVERLRQERANYRYNQRIARLEANAWMGYEPLRPSWSSLPMMSSRYPDRQTIIIPVLVD